MTLQIENQVADEQAINGNRPHKPTTEQIWPVPPLESGDQLTRTEFERRYHLHPEIKKAELIEGVVYVASPVRIRQHGEPHSRVVTWIGVYLASTPGVRMADNSTYRIDEENEPQPDVSVWIDRPGKARAQVDDDDYLIGAPELLIEVAASTASIDLRDKKAAYLRQGVQEYLVLQVYEQKATWFTLRAAEYHEITPNDQGVLQSSVFPGLWFDPAKFWAGDLAGLLTVLQQGLASPDHNAFISSVP